MDIELYEDDVECDGENCYEDANEISDYDYENANNEQSLENLFNNCIEVSVVFTFWYFLPLIAAAIACNLASKLSFINSNIFHITSIASGIFVLFYFAYEALFILVAFTLASYIFVYLSKKLSRQIIIILPSVALISYCELYLQPQDWHKIRGVTMVAIMKSLSLSIEKTEIESMKNILPYSGYILNGATCLFGPWVPFNCYLDLSKRNIWKIWWIVPACGYMVLSYIFLSVSNCWTTWILSDNAKRWLVAFRDAFAFRTSHYFISFYASSIMLLGGFSLSQTIITKPLDIELPRSLVQVVIYWNIPMHNWLKTYVFRTGRNYFGQFGGIILTYLASSLLHGLNFQLAAVLLSLGFYTYIEYKLRLLLAKEFDACIASKKCPLNGCSHLYTSRNSVWVNFTNILFCLVAIFHLAYLGLMFDTSDLQEAGYNYRHTIEKWSNLGFASHWLALFMYCAYFLIR